MTSNLILGAQAAPAPIAATKAPAGPDCFSPTQWRVWLKCETEMVERGDYVREPSGFCAQCTPEHQAQMKAENRCWHPRVTFRPDPDCPGDVIGVRPADELGRIETPWSGRVV